MLTQVPVHLKDLQESYRKEDVSPYLSTQIQMHLRPSVLDWVSHVGHELSDWLPVKG